MILITKQILFVSAFVITALSFNGCLQTNTTVSDKSINVLVCTGGKKIDSLSFLKVFSEMDNITYKHVIHPRSLEYIQSGEVNNFDIIVFYDLVQKINAVQRKAFLDLLQEGKPMLFLHHSLVSYQEWNEYEKIIGGRFRQSRNKSDSLKYKQSTYRHDVEIPVEIIKPNHPITRDIDDFIILDEVYGDIEIQNSVIPILKTSHPENTPYLGWENQYANSPIIYLQLGDKTSTYSNKTFRQLIRQSIHYLTKHSS